MTTTDLSPMERAVRALAPALTDGTWTFTSPGGTNSGPHRRDEMILSVIRHLGYLRTSDPDAFAAVLAECGVEAEREAWIGGLRFFACETEGVFNVDGMGLGLHLVSEGQAVIEGRVVGLEIGGYDDHGLLSTTPTVCHYATLHEAGSVHPTLYRVKPERSDRHTEDAS